MNIEIKQTGDSLLATEWNSVPQSLENVIIESGDTPRGIFSVSGTVDITDVSVVGTGTSFDTELEVGQMLSIFESPTTSRKIATITDATHLTLDTAFDNNYTDTELNGWDTNQFLSALNVLFAVPGLPDGYIKGLIPELATDTDHDITTSIGKARCSQNVMDLVLGSAMTKRLDAVWEAGDGNGGIAGIPASWEIDAFTYNSKSFDTSVQSVRTGCFFKTDGAKFYGANYSTDSIYAYDLSTDWDVSTSTYNSETYSPAEVSGIRGIAISSTGFKMYILDSTGSIYQYSLSTAWNISTASYDSVMFDVSTQLTVPQSLKFNDDGNKLFINDYSSSSGNLYAYDLSTAWDLSTASYNSETFDVTAQTNYVQDISFGDDGTVLYVASSYIISSTDAAIYEYSLSTAWDISTASYESRSLSIYTQTGSGGVSIATKTNGGAFYVLSTSNDTIYQYDYNNFPSLASATAYGFEIGNGTDTDIIYDTDIDCTNGLAYSGYTNYRRIGRVVFNASSNIEGFSNIVNNIETYNEIDTSNFFELNLSNNYVKQSGYEEFSSDNVTRAITLPVEMTDAHYHSIAVPTRSGFTYTWLAIQNTSAEVMTIRANAYTSANWATGAFWKVEGYAA